MEGKPAPVREDGDGRQSQSSRYVSGGGKERVFQGVRAWGKKKKNPHRNAMAYAMVVMAQRCVFVKSASSFP